MERLYKLEDLKNLNELSNESNEVSNQIEESQDELSEKEDTLESELLPDNLLEVTSELDVQCNEELSSLMIPACQYQSFVSVETGFTDLSTN